MHRRAFASLSPLLRRTPSSSTKSIGADIAAASKIVLVPCPSSPQAVGHFQRWQDALWNQKYTSVLIDPAVALLEHSSESTADRLTHAINMGVNDDGSGPASTVVVGHGLSALAALRYLESHACKAAVLLQPWTYEHSSRTEIDNAILSSAIKSAKEDFTRKQSLIESADVTGFPLLLAGWDVKGTAGLQNVLTFEKRYGGDVWFDDGKTAMPDVDETKNSASDSNDVEDAKMWSRCLYGVLQWLEGRNL